MNERLGWSGLLGVLLLAGCMGKEARSAGAVGCGPDEIEISDERRHGLLVQSGETWVASCRGRTFVCTQLNESSHGHSDGVTHLLANGLSSEQVTCREQVETPQEEENREARRTARLQQALTPKAALKGAPAGAGGFEFGMSREEAQRRCEAAGYAWSTEGAELGRCSGTAAPLGIPAHASVRFCEERACGVTLEHRPSAGWSREVVALKAKLETKYGAAEAATRGIPAECRTEEAFKGCLDAQRLELKYSWQWSSGEAVKMMVGKLAPSEGSGIRLEYSGSRVDASAL